MVPVRKAVIPISERERFPTSGECVVRRGASDRKWVVFFLLAVLH